MNDSEREEFDKITGQPNMAELRSSPKPDTANTVMFIGLALDVLIGGTTAVLLSSWRVGLVAFFAAVALLLLCTAISLRSK